MLTSNKLVGTNRFELLTSSLSGMRSNHLNYAPIFGHGQNRTDIYALQVHCSTIKLSAHIIVFPISQPVLLFKFYLEFKANGTP